MDDIWVTANGDKMPVKDMSDSHLVNAYRLCNRVLNDLNDKIESYTESHYLDENSFDWEYKKDMLFHEIKKRGVKL